MKRIACLLIVSVFALAGCSTTGNLGLVTRSAASPGTFLTENTQFKELGQAAGKACRHFILALIPFGQSDVAHAVDKALEGTGGDALINVSTESSLYGFVPIYNVYTYTCTKVHGTAIKFEN